MGKEEWSKARVLLFLAVLALAFYTVVQVHVNRPYPLHVDEWQHIALAKCTIESQGVCEINPYFTEKPGILNLEGGFHVLLAVLSLLGGIDLILDYRFLPALFAVISAVVLFSAVKRKTGLFLTAFFSVLFMASIKSNVNVLGFMFLTPLTLAIPLIYTLFNSVSEVIARASREFTLVSAVVFAALCVIHPPSALVLIPATLAYAIVKRGNAAENKRFFSAMALIIIVSSSLVFLMVWEQKIKQQYILGYKSGETKTLDIIRSLVSFDRQKRHVDIDYSLHEFYGIPQTLLSVLGLFLVVRRKQWFIVAWPATMIAWFLTASASDIQYLISYQRLVYYTLLSLVPLTAVGAAKFVELLERWLSSENFRRGVPRIFALSVATLLVVSMLSYSFRDYYRMLPDAPLYNILDESEYLLLEKLESKHGTGNIVYSDKWLSVTVYPVSGNNVVHMVTANLWGREQDTLSMESFNKLSCREKERFTEEHDVDFIITNKVIECGFLSLNQQEEDDRLYKVGL